MLVSLVVSAYLFGMIVWNSSWIPLNPSTGIVLSFNVWPPLEQRIHEGILKDSKPIGIFPMWPFGTKDWPVETLLHFEFLLDCK